jgi:hypothetical protein
MGDGWLWGDGVAKLIAPLLATEALWARIQTSLKNTKWRQKWQRGGKHTLARQKKNNKNADLYPCPDPAICLNAAQYPYSDLGLPSYRK